MNWLVDRRDFLKTCAGLVGGAALTRYRAMAAAEMGRAKIRDIQVMVLQGSRTYTLVKVLTDAGIYGIGEGYGSPGVGIKEGVLELREYFIGKDPLEIEALYQGLPRRVDGSAHMLLRAVSAIEPALWDVAGKLLNVPAATLLGGKFRTRVRMYHDEGPRNMLDKASCRDWAAKMKADPAGWTAFKFSPPRSTPETDRARDASNRLLTTKELRDIRQGFENCREAIGWEHDIIVHCHWEYDLRTAVQLAEAVESIKPLWLEDPMTPDFSNAWVRLTSVSKVPIGMGENLARRQGFVDFLMQKGCDIAQLDVRNTGGLLESKKIADLADINLIPMCAHNTGGILCNYATVQWACAVRDFLAAETIIGRGGWMDDVVLHDGPVVKGGHMTLPAKPGLGVELNPEVVKAHLAKGEVYWG
ncbi:MAG: mandelate racemase/muconate lactonizing enzyme family protein [Acidobacteriales bacterium]|nr:MAG: mandelate racemase/muconate lactonizing enzyme family protein [Terriglobales bacterium]